MREQHEDRLTAAASREQRYERGLEAMRRFDGHAGERIIEILEDISPELGHQIVAWAFGDMYFRPALPPRDRQLMTLSMLTALGGAETELELHINVSLAVGLTPEEIVEAFLHTAVYCGMPRALSATLVAKKVLGARGMLPVNSSSDQP
ncbi:carboxymuconolactone decarboxylase family protein [Nocardia beijingensis]|uniref:carboxymuconolactone decarboxylase family protein n=1 Tax=Nocardia beijingensis TaxID=95162 RepID=UPI003409FD26